MTEDQKLIAELRRDEGVKHRLYKDTVGKWTIGAGRNLDDVGLSDDEIDYLLANDIDRATALLDKYAAWWRQMNPTRQRVLANMVFNMGWGNGKRGLSSFKNTLAAMQRGDYRAASKGMLQSGWARQVGDRAKRLATMMETGNDL